VGVDLVELPPCNDFAVASSNSTIIGSSALIAFEELIKTVNANKNRKFFLMKFIRYFLSEA
jgi:hypothetical protein